MPRGTRTTSLRSGAYHEFSTSDTVVIEIDLSFFAPSPFEPQARRRAKFDENELRSLGQSIKQLGLAQPIVARKTSGAPGKPPLEIVFGERRWLGSGLAGLKTILCFVRELTDSQVIELQYEENHRRQKNDPLDDAYYFNYLKEKEGYTDEDLADRLSTSAHNVRDKLRLNNLIDAAKSELSDDRLPLKHAYYLSRFSPDAQMLIVRAQLAYKYQDCNEKPVSFEIFKEEVEENILRRLDAAPFAEDDPRLHVRGLLCPNCPDNSAYQTHLFPELAKAAHCLNKVCYEIKTNTHLRLQREEIARSKPNPANRAPAEIARDVPLVTERSYTNDRSPFAEKVLTGQELLDEPECGFSELSLAVEGEKKGRAVYVCLNNDCAIHNPLPAPLAMSDEELTEFEQNFEHRVARLVRMKILTAATEYFDDRRTFWQFDDLIKNLIVESLFERSGGGGENAGDVRHLVGDWKNAPRNFKSRDRLRSFVNDLDKREQSQILFLLSASGARSEVELLKICADYTRLNYLTLDAAARLELAPEEYKPAARLYLQQVENGQSADVPRFAQRGERFDHVETVFDDRAE